MSAPAELTDAELLVLKTMLEVLAASARGYSAPAWQGFTEARLDGEHISVKDFDTLVGLCVHRGYVVAASNPVSGKPRYALTQAGALDLKQLQS